MRILLDTNIVVDILAARKPYVDDSIAMLESHDELCISASQVTDIFYIVHRINPGFKARDLQGFIDNLTVLPVNSDVIHAAFSSGLTDFEDAVQEQVAAQNNVQVIITRNLKDFEASIIPAITPARYKR